MADRLYTVNKWNKKRYGNKYTNGGWFNLSQEVNPFSKQNYKGTIGALGPVVGQVGSGLISDGYSGGVGSGITNLGGTVGGAISTVNPLVGGIVSAASGVVGGLVNRAFGTKENKANINTITQNTQHMNQLGNQIAGAGDSTTFFNMAGNMGTSSGFSSGDLVKGGWFSRGKARRKAQKYLDAENSALAFQNHGMALGAFGVDQNQDDNTLYHFSAYGGPLDMINNDNMGAIEYGFMSDWLANKKAKEDRLKERGDNTTLMNEPLSTMFADGGGIEIKHPGRLTALKKRTGKTEAELWAEGKPEVRKMITFARNSRRWNRALGGYLDARDTLIEAGNLFEDGGLVPAINNIEEAPVDNTYIAQPRLTAPRTTKDVTRGMSTESPYLNSKDKLGYFLNDIYIQKNKNDKKAQNRRSITKEQAATIKDMVDKRYPEAAISRALSGMLNENYSNSFALGGDLQTHGSDWGNGMISINAGGSHEENKYGGVQIGQDANQVPNLVEEGEVIWNDYVYSNRIPIDEATKEKFHINKKRDMTYADLAKKLEKEIEERPNDPISKAGFQSQMLTLQEQQERQKQEMEAERARAAFESLSPEEQVAMMQQAAQQDAMAQQAAEEQAIAEQQAAQPSPEEMQMMQQQQAMQADGSQAALGQEPQVMAACGGKIKRFDFGGELINALGFHTKNEYTDWLKENGIEFSPEKESITYGEEGANYNKWMSAIANKNPALAHAMANNYDFGAYSPENINKATIQSISRGNWKATNGAGWFGSDDLAFKQATEGLTDEQIKALTTEQLAERMQATNAYKNTSKWLQNSDNALLYLNTLLNDPDTPEVAKKHALQYIKDGKWKDGYTYNYNDVFGKVRATNPGTYWHTAMEANRGNQAKNFVIGEDGKIEEIVGDVPTDWTAAGNYSWATPENDMTYNYYRRPSAAVPASPETPAVNTPEEEGNGIEPAQKADWMRYAGLFGPAVGLGMQIAGIGKPDYSDLDAAVQSSGNAHLATYKPIGNYLTYRPMDIWYEQNRMDANARATDRAIVNNAAPVGTKMAGLLASGYNNQIASGELYRKALEYNDAKRKDVAEFNRGTNQFNAEAYNRNSQFNAEMANRNREALAKLALTAADQKMDADAGWYNGIYGNIAGLFRGLGDLGTENYRMNRLAEMGADDIFGTLGNSNTGKKYVKEKAKGGKLNRKRGLTF